MSGTPFPGYGRTPEKTEELIEVLADALRAHPEQRLGQLLRNVTRGEDLWNVYDETFIHLLTTQAQE